MASAFSKVGIRKRTLSLFDDPVLVGFELILELRAFSLRVLLFLFRCLLKLLILVFLIVLCPRQ